MKIEGNSLKGRKPRENNSPKMKKKPKSSPKTPKNVEPSPTSIPHPARSATVTPNPPRSPDVKVKVEGDSLRGSSGSRTGSKSITGSKVSSSGTSGYSKTGYGSPGYTNGYGYCSGYRKRSSSLSYDDNHSKKELDQVIEENQSMDSCFLSSLFASTLIFIALFALLVHVHNTDTSAQREIIRHIPYSNQVIRKTLAILSENLDCSVSTKAKVLPGLNHDYLANMVTMCLHVAEPHSVAPDTTISFMYASKPSVAWRVQAISIYKLPVLPLGACNFGEPSNTKCMQESMLSCLNGHVQLEGLIGEGFLRSDMYVNGSDLYLELYHAMFQQFFGSFDGGYQEYEDAMATYDYDRNGKSASDLAMEDKLAPSFLVSPLFSKLAANKTMPQHIQLFTGNTITKDSTVTFNRKTTRFLMEKFMNHKTDRRVAEEGVIHVSLAKTIEDRRENRKLIIEVPKGPTLSLVSAFIVKVVYDTLKVKELDLNQTENLMYTMVALCHKAAISLLPQSKEWTGFGDERGLLSRTEEFVDVFRKTPVDQLQEAVNEYFKGPRVKRKNWDRVVSVLIWFTDRIELVQMQNSGLPRLFKSDYYANNRDTVARFTEGNRTSQPFMSSAGLFIVENQYDENESKMIHAVTSSGSIRTVDAVAIPILRMLLLKELPEKAVYAPAVYYDPQIGKIICEGDNAVDHPEFAAHAEKIRSALSKNGVECSMINESYFSSVDRTSFAMYKDLEMDEIYAAVDPRHSDKNNYAAGY